MINTLDTDLFYCKPWSNPQHSIDVNNFTIIVSDIVYGNKSHSTIQIHMAIMCNGVVQKAKDLCVRLHCASSKQVIYILEDTIRKCVYQNISWQGNSVDDSVIKIWYFRPESDPRRNDCSKECSDVYLRIAITAVDVCLMDVKSESILCNEIKESIRILLINH